GARGLDEADVALDRVEPHAFDAHRLVDAGDGAPMVPAHDARLLDNSALTIDQSVDTVLGWWTDGWPHVVAPQA
ncbi:hypothetical protein NL460_28140, partial [Klebsiella pneumoniae]|nr:hypothetical protein [Klebsiella pneumoniae]